MSVNGIPVIDVSPLESGSVEALEKVAEELCLAARTVGFFYIENHGVGQDQLDAVAEIAREFFGASEEQKSTVSISPFHRGWLSMGEAKMYGSAEADLKESFIWGLDVPADDPDFLAGGRLLAPNRWPEFLPGMRETLMDYFDAAQACGMRLLRALAMGLEIDPEHFLSDFDKPVSRGALIFYPSDPSGLRREEYGSAPHTDYGTMTLLYQDQVGGLQIRGRDGAWVDATPIEGTYVVNIGDLLARWSNDRFESTAHKVLGSGGRSRYSVGLFLDPNWDATVRPVTEDGEVAKYGAVGCAEYIMERYDEAFAYRTDRVGRQWEL